jgi:hypothetical protein
VKPQHFYALCERGRRGNGSAGGGRYGRTEGNTCGLAIGGYPSAPQGNKPDQCSLWTVDRGPFDAIFGSPIMACFAGNWAIVEDRNPDRLRAASLGIVYDPLQMSWREGNKKCTPTADNCLAFASAAALWTDRTVMMIWRAETRAHAGAVASRHLLGIGDTCPAGGSPDREQVSRYGEECGRACREAPPLGLPVFRRFM